MKYEAVPLEATYISRLHGGIIKSMMLVVR